MNRLDGQVGWLQRRGKQAHIVHLHMRVTWGRIGCIVAVRRQDAAIGYPQDARRHHGVNVGVGSQRRPDALGRAGTREKN